MVALCAGNVPVPLATVAPSKPLTAATLASNDADVWLDDETPAPAAVAAPVLSAPVATNRAKPVEPIVAVPAGSAQQAADDLIDAAACLVTAYRISRGMERSFPEAAVERDARGLRMEIVA